MSNDIDRARLRVLCWNQDRAFADEVEFLAVADQTARTNALVSDAVDAIDQVDLKTVSLLARKPGIHIEEVSGPLHYTFPMRTDVAPFDNNDVRLALKHAIDRQEILDKILHGHGSIGNDSPIGRRTGTTRERWSRSPTIRTRRSTTSTRRCPSTCCSPIRRRQGSI